MSDKSSWKIKQKATKKKEIGETRGNHKEPKRTTTEELELAAA